MSLIEQAAKRLEQLRQAGVEIPAPQAVPSDDQLVGKDHKRVKPAPKRGISTASLSGADGLEVAR